MSELAAEAGVTRPILYDNIGDRDAIAAALARRYTGNLGEALGPVVARDAPFADVLRDGIGVFCRFVDREPELWRFLQVATPPTHDDSIEQAVARVLATALRTALGRAGADPDLADVWAPAILGAVFLAAGTWSITRRISRRQLVDQVTALLVGGLAATGADTTRGPFGGSPVPRSSR